MSLFQFGFRPLSRQSTDEVERENNVPPSLPTLRESGLGRVEYDAVTSAVLDEPRQSTAPPAKIGKYALENGNKRAQRCFIKQFPDLG